MTFFKNILLHLCVERVVVVRGQLVGAGLCFHHENSGNSVLVARLGRQASLPTGLSHTANSVLFTSN